ncbi:MAG: hypothetical protein ACHQ7N_19055 [Candidatus Methylomirabilales bacterium]
MIAFKDILYEVREHAARITINRPKQDNAFTGNTLKEIPWRSRLPGPMRRWGWSC